MGFLSGIRIIDVTRGLAGPFATHAMTDYGAEIIRVDRPGEIRNGFELVHLRGRRSIAVDLASAEGLDVIRRLITTADVLLTEPALDGTPPLPWDYPTLSAQNPRLISCRITGYGDDGPIDPAMAPVIEAGGGVAEGFEQSEHDLIEHATDSYGSTRDILFDEIDEDVDDEDLEDDDTYGEADEARSSADWDDDY